MSSPRHSRALALLLALVPGWGHVYLGLERLGLALFTLTAAAAFVLVNSYLVTDGGHRLLVSRTAGGATILIWLLAVIDVGRRTSARRMEKVEERKTALLRSGMIAFLRDDLAAAEADLRACLKLDCQEVEGLFRLGIVLARRGDGRRARRLLRRARSLDLDGKWRWEIERELADMRERAKDGGGGPPSPSPGAEDGAAAEAVAADAAASPAGGPDRRAPAAGHRPPAGL